MERWGTYSTDSSRRLILHANLTILDHDSRPRADPDRNAPPRNTPLNDRSKSVNSRLIVAELNKTGTEHATFNSALLQSLYREAKRRNCQLQWFCEAAQRQAVLSLGHAELGSIPWRPVKIHSGLTRAFIKKFIRELAATAQLISKARRENASIIFLSVFPNILPLLLLTRRIFRRVPVHVILHGEIESLLIPEKQAINREGFWVKLALFHLYSPSWPSLYVLGSGIRERLLACFPDVKSLQTITAIEHPYPFTEIAPQAPSHRSARRIGFVGVGRRIKGILDFYHLAESLSTHVKRRELEFVLVGALEKGVAPQRHGVVTVLAPQGIGLSTDEYKRAISELDCAVFLSTQNYSLTASGSVFDIINAGVEIFTLKSAYLSDLSRLDVEGGIKFFASASEIAIEICRRLEHGWPTRRFLYPEIRRTHAPSLLDGIASVIIPQFPTQTEQT